MAVLTEDFERGTAGSALSSSNTAGLAPSATGTGSITFDATVKAEGTLSAKFNYGGTSPAFFQRYLFAGSSPIKKFDGLIRFDTDNPALAFLQFRGSTSPVCNLYCTYVDATNSSIRINSGSSTSASIGVAYTGTHASVYNTWHRVVLQVNTTTGDWQLDVYIGNGATASSVSGTTAALAATIDRVSIGEIAGATAGGNVWFDKFTLTDSTGPTPPVAAATLSSTYYRLIDARSSTVANSGGSLAYAISPTTGVFAIGDGRFLVPVGTTSVDYTVTVTETPSGLSDATDSPVTVPILQTGDLGDAQMVIYHAGVWG